MEWRLTTERGNEYGLSLGWKRSAGLLTLWREWVAVHFIVQRSHWHWGNGDIGYYDCRELRHFSLGPFISITWARPAK